MNIYRFIPQSTYELVQFAVLFGAAISLSPYAIAVLVLTVSIIFSSYTYIVKLFVASFVIYFLFGIICLSIGFFRPRSRFHERDPFRAIIGTSRISELTETDPALLPIPTRRKIRRVADICEDSESSISSASNSS